MPTATVTSPPEVISTLESFAGRGAGTDAERRAALWLAQGLRSRGRQARVETFWCRPGWALAHCWHLALAVAGSLAMVGSPRVGGGLLLAALVFAGLDALLGTSPGRWLTPARASQNVTSHSPEASPPGPPERLHLIITANYDAGRTGLAYRSSWRRPLGRLREAVHGLTPGWLGWIVLAVVWLLVIAILRVEGHRGAGVGAAQLPPTLLLLLALALLLELAASDWSPAAADNASGVAVALSLERALAVSPPRHLAVEVVLTGAGDGNPQGLRRHLRARRATHRGANTVVIGVAPCAAGQVRWWQSDGSLIPLRYGRRLLRLAEQVATQEPRLQARSHRGRGMTPALAARMASIPSITIGCLDEDGLVPRSHEPDDLAAAVDVRAHDQAVQFGLMLVDAIDAELEETASPAESQ